MAISAVGKKQRKQAPEPAVPSAGSQAPSSTPTAITLARMIAVSVLAGAAVTLSFAPFGLFPLAWLGVAVLFILWERCTPARAVLVGFTFGVGLFSTGGYWLYTGLMRNGGYAAATGVAGTAAVVVVCSVHVALAALARWICAGQHQRPLRLLAIVPGAWVLVGEWVRTWSLTGWLSLGYGQIDGPLAGFGPIGGVQLVSFASAVIAGALALAWLERPRWIAPAATIAGTVVIGWLLRGIDWTAAHGRPLEVAAVQGNVASGVKWLPSQLQPTLDLYAKATLDAMQTHKLDAVVWPETAIAARPDQVASFLSGLQQTTQPAGTTVILGIIDVERGAVPLYFNAALVTGAGSGSYRKRHLVPLTEYLPSFLPAAWQEEKKREAIAIFSPGADVQTHIRIGDVAVATTICYETSHGALLRDPEGKPGLLLSLTNDDWFMGTIMPAQDHQIVRMRALEAGREMLRVANSGITAWIGADGRVLAELHVQERATLFARMQPRTGLTPYWRWGDWVWVVATLLTGALVLAVTRIVRRARRDFVGG